MAKGKMKDTQLKTGESPSELPEGNGTVAVAEAPNPPAAQPVEQTPPPVQNGAHAQTANGNGHPANNNRGARQPDVSWRLNSDRSTSIEISAWVNEMTNQQTGETFEQVTFTIQRSYKDQNGQWCRGGSWRAHDVPILQFLLSRGHNWALERRMTTSDCPL